MIFGEQMRDDVVLRLLEGQPNLETSKFLDRLMELSTLEEAEHQFLIDPFDRSVALVFQMFQSSDLDPWDVDLSSFIEMFNERIERAENIDLPSCGRMIRMAWSILRGQASSLIERQERAMDFEEEVEWDFDGGWESEFDDADYNFSVGVMTGAADETLPSIFEGRIHRDEGRPVTLGELLLGLDLLAEVQCGSPVEVGYPLAAPVACVGDSYVVISQCEADLPQCDHNELCHAAPHSAEGCDLLGVEWVEVLVHLVEVVERTGFVVLYREY